MKKLDEFTVVDFRNQASSLTKKFSKERISLVGRESKIAILKEIIFHRKDGSFTAIWLTPGTFGSRVMVVPTASGRFKQANAYKMRVRFLDAKDWKTNKYRDITRAEVRGLLNAADIYCDCDCASMQYQGARYNLDQIASALVPVTIPDPVWRQRHSGGMLVCKHLESLFKSIRSTAPVLQNKIQQEAKSQNVIY